MSNKPLLNNRIILGVTGSIACYKSADLASKLSQAGAEVDTVLTRSATEFVSPLTFQSVTGRRAYTDDDLWGSEAHVLHIGLAHEADLLLIAPATAHTIAKLAHGLAGDLLTSPRLPLLVRWSSRRLWTLACSRMLPRKPMFNCCKTAAPSSSARKKAILHPASLPRAA